MSLEQAIHQYGGVGLLMWAVTLIIPIFVAWWRAGIKAQTVVSAEREVITNMLTKRDEDAREQAAKTEKLEGEIYLLKSTMPLMSLQLRNPYYDYWCEQVTRER